MGVDHRRITEVVTSELLLPGIALSGSRKDNFRHGGPPLSCGGSESRNFRPMRGIAFFFYTTLYSAMTPKSLLVLGSLAATLCVASASGQVCGAQATKYQAYCTGPGCQGYVQYQVAQWAQSGWWYLPYQESCCASQFTTYVNSGDQCGLVAPVRASATPAPRTSPSRPLMYVATPCGWNIVYDNDKRIPVIG